MKFIGREHELEKLNTEFSKENFSMCVIYGRRRVGKTYLIQKFMKEKSGSYFVGVESDKFINLNHLSQSIYKACNYYGNLPTFSDIDHAFRFLFEYSVNHRIAFVIDEYPYIAESFPSISSVLQNLIDEFKATSKLFLILCGSSMSFMENQVLGYKSPLYGRRSIQLKINPFSYKESAKFVENYSNHDKAIVFGLTGGVAEYLVFFDDSISLQENIVNNFLSVQGRLYEEPSNLLKQELRDPKRYNDILYLISHGQTKVSEISNKLGVQSGSISPYLESLIELGIIERKTPVTNRKSNRPIYLIKDTMFNFWYKFVQPNLNLINLELGHRVYSEKIENSINDYMGKIFEKISIEYLEYRIKSGDLRFLPTDYGNWWGNDSLRKKQSEIDILAYDSENYLFVECKWRNGLCSKSVLNELIEKSKIFNSNQKFYWIISMSGFEDFSYDDNVELITLDDMYA